MGLAVKGHKSGSRPCMFCEGAVVVILGTRHFADILRGGARKSGEICGGYPQIGDKCACKFGNLREGARKLALDLREGVRNGQASQLHGHSPDL